jgi:hypothetical protein
MKTRKYYSLVFVAVCVVVGLSAFRIRASRAGASERQVDFPVRSLVPKLTIVSVRVRHALVLLSLRNDYDKTITAFSVSSSGVITRNELIDTDEVIAPGSTITGPYELPSPLRTETGVTVRAALFEDGTAEGDRHFIKQIIDARAGNQAQLARILPILQHAFDTSKNVDLKQEWQTVKLGVAQLPEREEEKSFEFCAALHDEKELLLGKIKRLEQLQEERGDDVARQVLGDIKERLERKNVMLQRSLKPSL